MKKWWHTAVLVLVLVGIAALYAWQKWPIPIYDTTYDTSEMLPSLVGNDEVTQEFTSFHNGLCGIQIRLVKSGRTEFGNYIWKLSDEDGNEIYSGKVEPDETDYRGDYRIKFDQIQNSKNQKYQFSICADGVESEDESLTVYISIPKKGAGTVTLNGEEQEGSLMLQNIDHYFSLETFFVGLCLLFFLVLFIRVMSKLFS